MKPVIWSPKSQDDIRQIAFWILKDNPKAAIDTVDRIETCANKLAMSDTGRKGRTGETREKVVTGLPYVLVYDLDESALKVLRVIHGARNWLPGEWPEE